MSSKNNNQLLNDPEWLREQYVEKKRFAIDIAKELEVCKGTVCNRLREFDIPVRGRGGRKGCAGRPKGSYSSKYHQLNDREWIVERYIKQHTSVEGIATECGCSRGAVYGSLRRYDIPLQPAPRLPRRLGPRSLGDIAKRGCRTKEQIEHFEKRKKCYFRKARAILAGLNPPMDCDDNE